MGRTPLLPWGAMYRFGCPCHGLHKADEWSLHSTKRVVSDPDPLGLEPESCPHIKDSLTYRLEIFHIDRWNSCDLVEVGILGLAAPVTEL